MPNYIDNNKFEEVILEYLLTSSLTSEEELVDMFDVLITNIIEGFKFTLSEDAKQDCFLLVIKTLRKFNPDSGSAFNYFTTVIVNNLRLIYTKDKKYNEKIAAFIELRKDQLLKNS